MRKREFALSISAFTSDDKEKIVLFRVIDKELYQQIQALIATKETDSFKDFAESLNDLAISQIQKKG